MTASRRDNEALFHAARDIPDPDRRRAYVRQACGGDQTRIAHLEALLAAADAPDSLLDRAAASDAGATIDQPPTASPGTVMGPYKLVEEIGQGGMGSVWMAQQHEPIKRLVAVKLIKAGMDSKQVIARFEAERQALALMDHPNIARVLDAGATGAGRPYFVMDLVKGVPITRYCDAHQLTPRQRLELFLPVCRAVQHAHQKGIIHRDLKPSNVLVALYDGRPVPKVIDFGVAKATGQQLTEQTLHTGFGEVVGTVEYMSPEQASFNQLDVDTRSDIYSLGVLLYELLAGSPPFSSRELEKAGVLEMLRVIREQEPPKPSTKLSTAAGLPALAASRGTEPAKLAKLVRGELDWIVLKALEKDRTRRYDTASGLARDVQHYLVDEPVQACPPSATYRLRKFVKKNRAALTTAAAIVFLLVGGTLVSTWQAVRATRAERTAEQQRDHAQEQTIRATQEAEQSRRLRFVTDIKVAHQLSEAGSTQLARELLDRHRPQPGQEDLRGFEWYYLDHMSRSSLCLLPLNGHTGESHGVAYRPDGRRVAAAGQDRIVRVWDTETGREVLTLTGHTEPVFGVAFSPDGRWIAAAGKAKAIKVWDAETGQERFTIQAEKDATDIGIVRVVYSPDGRSIAAGVHSVLTVWDAETGRERIVFRGHTSWIAGVAFRADGRRIASASDDGTVRVWELETGEEVLTLAGHRGLVWGVAYSPDGRRVASGGVDQTVRIWDAETGRQLSLLSEQIQTVHSVAFSPDGRRLASAGVDGMVRIWDVETGQELDAYKGHNNAICQAVFSPDGRRIASSSWDGTVRVWDATAGQGRVRLEGHADEVIFAAYSPAGPFLATAGKDRVVKVWDAATRRELRTLRGHQDEVVAVAFGPHGRRLASATFDGTVKVWEAATGRELLTFRGHQDKVRGVAFSPDGRSLASAGIDGMVRIWDVETGQERLRLDGHATEVRWAAFSPDGRRIVSTGHFDGTVRLWDAATGRKLLLLNTGTSRAGVAVFSPDGRSLAVTTQDGGAVKVWDAVSGDERLTLRGHIGEVWAVAYSPDGRRIASGGTDRTIRIWDAATGQDLLTLKGHTDAVTALAFRPNGRQLASTSLDRTARLWDATPLPRPVGHQPKQKAFGLYAAARAQVERALELRRRALGKGDPAALSSVTFLACSCASRVGHPESPAVKEASRRREGP